MPNPMSFSSLSLSLSLSHRDLLDRLAREDRLVKRENKVLEVTMEKMEVLVCLVTLERLDDPVHQVLLGQRDSGYV